MKLYIGIDGTDSPFGGCTTWTLSRLVDDLFQKDPTIKFLDYPRLIRLNPNIPHKTRGNGALSITVDTKLLPDQVFQLSQNRIKKDQALYELEDKLPGLIITKEKPPSYFYYKALREYVSLDWLYSQSDFNPIYKWPEASISHIGAFAAIASDLSYDFTFELIAYRTLETCGKLRIINAEHVKKLQKEFPKTFSSYDEEQHRELIAPSGPDPVFFGIRAEDSEPLRKIKERFSPEETPESYTIFKSNQGTNSHVLEPKCYLQEYEVFSSKVTITEKPQEIQGGHVFVNCKIPTFCIENPYQTDTAQLSFFEPTKNLRDKSRLLLPGDEIYIHGSCHKNEGIWNIHVEYMSIIYCPSEITFKAPFCKCGHRMTSSGSFKGYKCKNCSQTQLSPEITHRERELFSGQKIYASKSAQRHLTKPEDRLHKKNASGEIKGKTDYYQFRFT